MVSESCPLVRPSSIVKLVVAETLSTFIHSDEAADTVFAQKTVFPLEGMDVPEVTTTVVPPAATSADAATARHAAEAATTDARGLQVSFPEACALPSTRYSVPCVPKAAVDALPWSMKIAVFLTPTTESTEDVTCVLAATD